MWVQRLICKKELTSGNKVRHKLPASVSPTSISAHSQRQNEKGLRVREGITSERGAKGVMLRSADSPPERRFIISFRQSSLNRIFFK